jgi:bifunctional non-homologous end joining protein LigD
MRAGRRRKAAPRDKSLARYRAKRDFEATPEPRGAQGRSGGHRYLIQKHAARRLHYDFRLEMDGVLKSWAVTRGPSLDPADKRLAVHVEDHPLAYGDFEGTIPKPQYGGGTVMLWDEGSWEPLGDPDAMMRAGRLKFRLEGERLKGEWNLVRMRRRSPRDKHDNWLLIKGRDGEAKPGDGGALLEEADRSVRSGRSMEEIARGSSVWHSNRGDAGADGRDAAKAARPKPSPAKTVKAAGKRGRLPDFVEPQLATRVGAPPAGEGWVHEIKLDGYRIQARLDGGKVSLLTRRGLDWCKRFPAIAKAVGALPAKTALLDGEIVAFEADGLSNFGQLQAILSGDEQGELVFVLFDLLYLDGQDLRALPLLERKARLLGLLGATERGVLRFSQHFDRDGGEIYRHACELALEGVVSKRAQDPYRSGRGTGWLKSKCRERQEFVIGGFTRPAKGRPGVGALLLGYGDGGRLRYAGRVGTGFGRAQSLALRRRLEPIRQDEPPFAAIPAAARRGVTYVEPSLVCETEFATWTRDGLVRQASFLGLREDKPASEITREKVMRRASRSPGPAEPEKPTVAASRKRKATAAGKAESGAKGEQDFHGVRLTHPGRLLYEEPAISKLDLAQYYVDVADRIMPHVKHRPLAIVRCPDGASGTCFFQKHLSAGMPDAIKPFSVKSKEGARESYVSIEDERGLIALVQFGVLEIHPWGASADDVDKADRIIFDLDPDPKVEWPDVIAAAKEVRDRLQELKLESFVKTTGGKGLHVVAPLRPAVAWEPVKRLTQAIAFSMAADKPALYLAKSSKAARGGKIFIDYLRNDRGSTAVAPYSTRARAGAPISAPLDWRELNARLRSDRYRLGNIRDRLAALPRDPWEGFFDIRQSLGAKTLSALKTSR